MDNDDIYLCVFMKFTMILNILLKILKGPQLLHILEFT
jgi:hypothetical protein